MVVGGKLLEAQEMRGRKLPINPVLLSQNPDKSREFRSIPSEGTIWTATKNGQCPITSDYFHRIPHNAHRCSLSSRGLHIRHKQRASSNRLGHSIRLRKKKGEARVEPRLMPRIRSRNNAGQRGCFSAARYCRSVQTRRLFPAR